MSSAPIRLLLLLSISLHAQSIFRLEATVDKPRHYRGEPITVTYTFYKRHDHDGVDFKFVPPHPAHFWIKTQHAGRTFEEGRYSVTRYRVVMAAQRSGVQTLEPATMRVARRGYVKDAWGSFKSVLKWEEVPSAVLQVEVLPLPAGIDLVGALKVTSQVSAEQIEAGRPVVWTLRFESRGNLEDLLPPEPAISAITSFASEPTIHYHWDGPDYVGIYERAFTLIAGQDYTIPALRYAWFDPASQQVQVTRTEARRIRVSGGSAVEPPKPPPAPQGTPWLPWLLVPPVLLFGLYRLFRHLRPDLRRMLAALLPHLGDAEAAQTADVLEKKLYEDADLPVDTKALRALRSRLRGPQRKPPRR